jgi:2'-5' RNA ligase
VTQRLAIIAYPQFTEADRAALQAVRAQHDPQFGMLAPHFTLVFPVEAPPEALVAEAQSATRAINAFPFTLRSVRAVRDAFGVGGHVFLVPDQGATQVSALHARLYGGSLSWAHRADIPYVPHITVAAHADFGRCEALAKQLEGDRKDLTGWVEALTVVAIAGASVTTVAFLPLAGAAKCD